MVGGYTMRYRNFLSVSTLAILGAILPTISLAFDFGGLGATGAGYVAGQKAAQDAQDAQQAGQAKEYSNEQAASITRQMLEQERRQQQIRQQQSTVQQRDEFLKNIAQQLNATAPKMLDADSRLDFVSNTTGRLIYYVTWIKLSLQPGAALSPEAQGSAAFNIRNMICANVGMWPILNSGSEVEYVYHDNKDARVLDVVVSSRDCPSR